MARRIMLNGTSYFGQGAIQEIVNEIKNRHFKKVLVTSTPDLFEFKVATKVTDLLDAAGIAYDVYDNIKPNPTIENVTSGVAACKAAGAEAIVAVGGGSAIDTSKAIATIVTTLSSAMCVVLKGWRLPNILACRLSLCPPHLVRLQRLLLTTLLQMLKRIVNSYVLTLMIFQS